MKLCLIVCLFSSISADVHRYYTPQGVRGNLQGFGSTGPNFYTISSKPIHEIGGFDTYFGPMPSSHGLIPNYEPIRVPMNQGGRYAFTGFGGGNFFNYGEDSGDYIGRSGLQSFTFPYNDGNGRPGGLQSYVSHLNDDILGQETLFQIWKKLYHSPAPLCPESSSQKSSPESRSPRSRFPIQTSSPYPVSGYSVDPRSRGIHFIDHPQGIPFHVYNSIFNQRVNVPRGWSKWTRKCIPRLDSFAQNKNFPEDRGEDNEGVGVVEDVGEVPKERVEETQRETESDGVAEERSGGSLHGTESCLVPESVDGFPEDVSGDTVHRMDSRDDESVDKVPENFLDVITVL